MNDEIINYKHHGTRVFVRESLKGKHREHCLCWQCKHFTPNHRDNNCPIANVLFSLCVVFGLTIPVWECPDYDHGEQQ